MPPAVEIPQPVRVELAHAVAQATARQAGVDALLIKGHATDSRLYYPGRSSTDVDVLVRPLHVSRMARVLESVGWVTVTTFRSGSSFQHAQTMSHPAWGLMDVHRYFPGFDGPAADTFESLWRDRVTMPVAHYPCEVPQLVDQALLIAVHSARTAAGTRYDMTHLRRVLGPSDWRALESRAQELNAHVAFAAANGTLDTYRDHPSYDLWSVLALGGTRSQEWRARMRAATTMRQRARIVARAPLPNLDHLRMDLGHEPTPSQIAQATVRRPLQAAREFVRGQAKLDTDKLIASIAEQFGKTTPPACTERATVEAAGEFAGLLDAAGQPDASVERSAATPRLGRVAAGSLRPGPDIAVVEEPVKAMVPGEESMSRPDDPVFLARVPREPPQILMGSAAVIWRAAREVPESDVARLVADTTGQDPQAITGDVLGFVERLKHHGILISTTP